MKNLSLLTLVAMLSFTSCSMFQKSCCKPKNETQCSKEKCDKPCCDKEKKCSDSSCDKKSAESCKDDSCKKK